ncbi:MAG: ABC transporter permease [Chloroflexi bacterium]|nr:ABC transporter permease [Chloroflexota bacterium]
MDMDWIRYVLRRLALFVPTLLVISFITFALGYFGPGDPIRTIMGDNWADEATYQILRHQYGLDRPLMVQYGDFLQGVFRGDFGRSLSGRLTVGELMTRSLPISMQLGLVAMVFLAVFGIGLGILAAIRQNTWVDYLIIVSTVIGHSTPVFVLAPMLLILFVLKLQLFPTPSGWDGIFSVKVILPAALLAVGPIISVVRQTRASVIEVLSQDYVRTARAKGLPGQLVILRHILKNSLTPVITLMGFLFAGLITGSIFVESIFSIPGFGQLFYQAIRQYDYPVLMGTTLVSALIIVSANLIVDLLYGFLDPRIRYK